MRNRMFSGTRQAHTDTYISRIGAEAEFTCTIYHQGNPIVYMSEKNKADGGR